MITKLKAEVDHTLEYWKAYFEALEAERKQLRIEAGVITPFEAQYGRDK